MPRKELAVKRVYDDGGREGDARFLVERLWPRGVKKEALDIDAWLKDVAPSDKLRRWYGHDPAKWMDGPGRQLDRVFQRGPGEVGRSLLLTRTPA